MMDNWIIHFKAAVYLLIGNSLTCIQKHMHRRILIWGHRDVFLVLTSPSRYVNAPLSAQVMLPLPGKDLSTTKRSTGSIKIMFLC